MKNDFLNNTNKNNFNQTYDTDAFYNTGNPLQDQINKLVEAYKIIKPLFCREISNIILLTKIKARSGIYL